MHCLSCAAGLFRLCSFWLYAGIDSEAAAQWSSICRKLGRAAQNVLLGRKYLESWSSPPSRSPLCLDSQLLLRWAPCVKTLFLDAWSIKCHGIRQYVAAAVNLTLMIIEIAQEEDSACADSVVCASHSVVHLYSVESGSNSYLPHTLPQQLQKLDIDLKILAMKQPQSTLQPRFEAFLSMLCNLRHLRTLSIDCANFVLRCSVPLPNLEMLRLRLGLSKGTPVDFSWLRSQHHDKLQLCLRLDKCDAAMNMCVMSEAQQVHITDLHLVVPRFSLASQQIWQSYSGCESFNLEFSWNCSSKVVHALPVCSLVTVTVQCNLLSGMAARQAKPSPLIIHWQALARPGRLHVCSHISNVQVQVQGFAHPIPDSRSGPWQLVAHAKAGVEGLPASRPPLAPATYFLQNAAADAAGWEGSMPLYPW